MGRGTALQQLKQINAASNAALESSTAEAEAGSSSEMLEQAAGALTMVLGHLGAIFGEIDQSAAATQAGLCDEWDQLVTDLGNSQRSAMNLLIAVRGGNDESEVPNDSRPWIGQ